MRNVNILFDNAFDDVDIICVPNSVVETLDETMVEFVAWMRNKENNHIFWTTNSKGVKVLIIETDVLVWWLNNHCNKSSEKSYIVSQHVKLVADYPTIYF